MAITAGRPGIFPVNVHKAEKPQPMLYDNNLACLLRASINGSENEVARENLTERLARLKSGLTLLDGKFIEDLLLGIIVTACNGARLESPEKERREWGIPAHEVTRAFAILQLHSMSDEERKSMLKLFVDCERYAIKIAEDALQEDIYRYFDVLGEARRTFKPYNYFPPKAAHGSDKGSIDEKP